LNCEPRTFESLSKDYILTPIFYDDTLKIRLDKNTTLEIKFVGK